MQLLPLYGERAGLREAASAARDKFSAYAASFTFCFNREALQRAAELAKLPHQG
jgi:hypothetical protein